MNTQKNQKETIILHMTSKSNRNINYNAKKQNSKACKVNQSSFMIVHQI